MSADRLEIIHNMGSVTEAFLLDKSGTDRVGNLGSWLWDADTMSGHGWTLADETGQEFGDDITDHDEWLRQVEHFARVLS